MSTTFEQAKESIGTGWWPIAKALHVTIDSLAPGYEVLQVKEKFGGLRFYYRLPNGTSELVRDTVQVMVAAAESLSVRTCEKCGDPGRNRQSHYWWITLCDSHFEEREQQRAQEMAGRAASPEETDTEKPVDPDCTCWSPEGGHDGDCAVWTKETT